MGILSRNDQSAAFRKLNPHLFGGPAGAQKPAKSGVSGPKATTGPKTGLAEVFESLWELAKGPALTPEWRFSQTRNWRFDYAIPAAKFAIELEGITAQGGRHQRKDGFQADAEKYLAAWLEGWSVVRLTRRQLTEVAVCAIVARVLDCENTRKYS